MKRMFAVIFILGVMLVGSAFADILDRIGNQQRRIDQGISSGELTRAETDILQDNLNWIKVEFSRMKADGLLTRNEISRLDQMLDRTDAMIRNKKNNPIQRVYQADIPARIANQQFAINQGISSGELTRAEADILQDNLNWVKAEFSRMKADGRLTQNEIVRLDGMLDQTAAMIFNKKHNPIKRVYQADIPERIANQQFAINQGISSGELTRAEADILQDNLNWIKAEFSRMKADGRLTQREISRLDQMLDQSAAMIFNKKHNPVKRVYQADIPERIANQQYRIDQGIASGTLTRGEADLLLSNLNWIKTRFARMKADGRLTTKEIAKLERMLDNNSGMIFNKKNNPVRRLY